MLNPLNRIPLFRENKCKINSDVQELHKNPPDHIGPSLKFNECANGIWKGDILLVHKPHIKPTLCLESSKTEPKITLRTILSTEHGYNFTRWDISVKQQDRGIRQDYYIALDENRTKSLCFFIPGTTETWRWCFFSCNDLSHTSGYPGYAEKYGGVVPLWTDLVHNHHVHNYNLMVGLGDQVYLDEVFEHVKELNQWTFFASRVEREAMACPQSIINDVDTWSFYYYLRHFSQPYFEQALATIPSLFVMSDHDTYDGQGSYPEDLENSSVLRQVRKVLRKYYLLFQQHTNPYEVFEKMESPVKSIYGDGTTPFVRQLGENLGILGLDTRFERTRHRIIPQETYDYIFSKLEKLPDTITHLVVATEIPLIFPDLRLVEKWLMKMSNLKRKNAFHTLFKGTTFFKTLGLPFGEPLLLTDLVDHWNSVQHIAERNEFIWRLQEFSKNRSVRVTFIGGDVHCAGVGRFAAPSTSKDKVRAYYEDRMIHTPNFAQDYKLMYQIISSAIANVPPPKWIIKGYHIIDRPEKITNSNGDVTDGRMLRFFLRDSKGRVLQRSSKKLMGRRNWCSVEMSSIDESLFFQLHVELFLGAGKTDKYDIVVPSLEYNITR